MQQCGVGQKVVVWQMLEVLPISASRGMASEVSRAGGASQPDNWLSTFWLCGSWKLTVMIDTIARVVNCAIAHAITSAVATAAILTTTIVPINAQQRLTEQSRVAINGIGPVRVGMTVAEAERAAGVTFRLQDPPGRDVSCYYMVPNRGVRGLAFMVILPQAGRPDRQQGRIARVDIASNSPVLTISGAGIGDFEARIRTLYPGIQSSPHAYIGNWRYLTLVPQNEVDRAYRLVFETDGRRVRSFRAGKLPEVDYPEGC